MRKLMLFLTVTVVLLLFVSINPVDAQRTVRVGTEESAATVVPVSVLNFPGSQLVSGTVTVGNFPHTVTVAGTVITQPASPRVVGFTTTGFLEPAQSLALTRACSDEFPGARVCETSEVFRSVPAPASWPVQAYVMTPSFLQNDCMTETGQVLTACSTTVSAPAACCSF